MSSTIIYSLEAPLTLGRLIFRALDVGLVEFMLEKWFERRFQVLCCIWCVLLNIKKE